MIDSSEIRSRFLAFFQKRGHAVIPSASLIPAEDVSAAASSQTLFTTAGMQPLIPYLLGKPHSAGSRLVDCQKCVRTGDIDDVGDNRHLTFFEMLGNWSLGDYFKKEAIEWSFEFLTSKTAGLGLDPARIYVTVFKGEDGIPRDEESIRIWQDVFKKHGLSHGTAGDDEKITDAVRIIPLGVKDNFWIAGNTGPCGGDTEMFYDTRPDDGKLEGKFSDVVDSFRLIEVWNDVFMEFNKTAGGQYEKLATKNVDTGMGLERTTAVVNGLSNVFETDCFTDAIDVLQKISKEEQPHAMRIIADHVRTVLFMSAEGLVPSNKDRGYVMRRLIRRAAIYTKKLTLDYRPVWIKLLNAFTEKYRDHYPELLAVEKADYAVILTELDKFAETLERGYKEFDKGTDPFVLATTYGFPIEAVLEIANEKGLKIDIDAFNKKMTEHQELSKTSSVEMFKGGLGDTSDMSLRYHTATHLLNAALKQVVGPHVSQKGSNITPERLRFDFSHSGKMTGEEKENVEELVNGWITAALPVTCTEMPKAEAEKIATHAFNEKYGETVKVYSIGTEGNYISREFCGGPHVANTSELGHFKIQKEEAVSAGIRRIRAILT